MPFEADDAEQFSLVRRELRAAREPFRQLASFRKLQSAPRGTCGVMVMPGFTAGDRAMFPLRTYLRRRGHRVWGWDLGVNRGDVDRNLPKVIEQVERRVAENHDRPLVLIGWSLGGVFAREVARSRRDLVSRVITLASPAQSYSRAAGDPNASRILRPITAFFSKRDGVVAWQGCIDELNPDVTMIEVDSSHVGMTLDPTVWLEITDQLAD